MSKANHMTGRALVAGLWLAPLLLGCGTAAAPDAPSFETDVKPIMLARCVRCHGAGGTLNADPHAVLAYPPVDGYFDHYGDLGDCSADGGFLSPTCRHGAATFATLMRLYIMPGAQLRMPPPPTPELTSRQRDIITRWATETPPKP